jgi:hypothetical protein
LAAVAAARLAHFQPPQHDDEDDDGEYDDLDDTDDYPSSAGRTTNGGNKQAKGVRRARKEKRTFPGVEDALVYTHIVERKSVTDLIQSSSDGMTGRHYVQERKIRFSGIRTPVFLVEGVCTAAHGAQIKPFVYGHANTRYDGGEPMYWQADVIKDHTDIICHFASIVARNIGKDHCVFIMQTNHENYTALWLSALTLCANTEFLESSAKRERVTAGNSSCATANADADNTFVRLSAFSKFVCGWGGNKIGRQSVLRNDLEAIEHQSIIDVSALARMNMHSTSLISDLIDKLAKEITERVVRRFGDQLAVDHTLSCCSTLNNKSCLFKDLSPSCSNAEVCSLTKLHEFLQKKFGIALDDMSDSGESVYRDIILKCDNPLISYVANQVSMNIVEAISAKNRPSLASQSSNADNLFDITQSTNRITKVLVSPPMFDAFGGMQEFPNFILSKQMQAVHVRGVDDDEDIEDCGEDLVQLRWVKIQTIDSSFGAYRQSSIMDVVVLDGVQIMECLLTAIELLGTAHGSQASTEYDMSVVRYASVLLFGEIDRQKQKAMSCSSSSSSSTFIQAGQGVHVQSVLVLENLIGKQGNAGAVAKLRSTVGKCEGSLTQDRREQDQHSQAEYGDNFDAEADQVISLRAKPKSTARRRPRAKSAKKQSGTSSLSPLPTGLEEPAAESAVHAAFPLRVAQKLTTNAVWYVYLLFACLTTEYRVQLFQSTNESETKIFVSALMRASNDSSMLLY